MRQLETMTDEQWKMRTLIMGAIVGAILGVGTAYLLNRTAEESGGGPPQITTGDAVKAAIGIVGVMRGIASLGDR
jgi:hypothetical protein